MLGIELLGFFILILVVSPSPIDIAIPLSNLSPSDLGG